LFFSKYLEIIALIFVKKKLTLKWENNIRTSVLKHSI